MNVHCNASSNTVSPLDLALETMGSFETALSLLCCGADVITNFHGEDAMRYHDDNHQQDDSGNGSIVLSGKNQQGQGRDDDDGMMTQSLSSPTSISNNA